MNLIYDSEQYSVVEFSIDAELEALHFGGYEITDKSGKREIFIGGSWAETFRQHVEQLAADGPTIEDIDAFLAGYDEVMQQPVVVH
jgi:hypothetical protein